MSEDKVKRHDTLERIERFCVATNTFPAMVGEQVTLGHAAFVVNSFGDEMVTLRIRPGSHIVGIKKLGRAVAMWEMEQKPPAGQGDSEKVVTLSSRG